MNRNVVIGAVIAAAVVVGAVVLPGSGGDKNASATPTPAEAATPAQSATASSSTTKAAVTVKYTADGFSPKEIRVKSGETIFFDNSVDVQVSSDPHPTHTNNPELNTKETAAGKGVLLTVHKKGTFGIHDHLNPSNRATIIVE